MSRVPGIFAALAVLAAASVAGAAAPAVDTASTSREGVRRLVSQISAENGLDPRLVHAVVQVESGYNPKAVSRRGALGLMQLMPDTAQRLDVANPFDPEENIRGGVRELARLIDVYGGDLALALAAYNAGEGAVARYGGVPPYAETNAYVDRILSLYLGRPYHRRVSARAPVRLLRDHGGGVLITNQGSAGRPPSNLPRLGSGIRMQRPAGAAGTPLRGGFGSPNG